MQDDLQFNWRSHLSLGKDARDRDEYSVLQKVVFVALLLSFFGKCTPRVTIRLASRTHQLDRIQRRVKEEAVSRWIPAVSLYPFNTMYCRLFIEAEDGTYANGPQLALFSP
jgi:hypothetical protein